MQRKMIKFILFTIILIFYGCDNKIYVDDHFFTVKFDHNQFFKSKLLKSSKLKGYTGYVSGIDTNIHSNGYQISTYFYNERDEFLNFRNNFAEIFYLQSFAVLNKKVYKPQTFAIFIALDKSLERCYYLIYESKESNHRFSNFNDILRKSELNNVLLIDRIDENDTIYSNLNHSQIRKIIPDFTGKLVDGEISKIELDTTSFQSNDFFDYKPGFADKVFYQNIRLVNLTSNLIPLHLKKMKEQLDKWI